MLIYIKTFHWWVRTSTGTLAHGLFLKATLWVGPHSPGCVNSAWHQSRGVCSDEYWFTVDSKLYNTITCKYWCCVISQHVTRKKDGDKEATEKKSGNGKEKQRVCIMQGWHAGGRSSPAPVERQTISLLNLVFESIHDPLRRFAGALIFSALLMLKLAQTFWRHQFLVVDTIGNSKMCDS